MNIRCPLWVVVTVTCLSCTPVPETRHRLYDLFERDWQFRLDEDPMFATSVGDYRGNHLLTSVTPEDLERRADFDRQLLADLLALDAGSSGDAASGPDSGRWASLSKEDRINAQIFERQIRDRIAGFELGAWQIPFNADSGFHIGFARLPRSVPLRTTKNYEDYLSRLKAWPGHVEQRIANMRLGIQRGMVLPRVVLEGYETTMTSHVVEDPETSVFWHAFKKFPRGVPDADRERLRQAGREAIREGIVRGYRNLAEFFSGEYEPQARQSIAATDLPEGEAYYAQRVKFFTTLDITADEIHALGLAEVERIGNEMQTILEEVDFQGTMQEFLHFLRHDRRFYAKDPEALLKEASYIAKQIDGKLPSLFKTLPRLPYTVEPVPDHMAPKYTTGRYVGPPEGSYEPGIYWVNTYNLDNRPLYNLTALTLHESVPGHHLQGSLAREQAEQPNFRRHDYISTFGEGWGLYAEWLGVEMGIYRDPYSHFGRLSYEMWRACRLVVDTGMHAKGWSRRQAMDYLARRTALPLHEIRTETDRYISWPAQALAYKMGELKIKQLRRRAEEALGERFDVREFHDAVLLNGSVPLPVLEELIEDYIAEKAG